GDIAYSGKPAEYQDATTFFESLLEAAGLDKSRLFVVPGNHDVDRSRVQWLQRTLKDQHSSNEYFKPGGDKDHISKGQRAFVDWYNDFFKGVRDPFDEDKSCGPPIELLVNNCRLGVLPLNSALFRCEDHENSDHGKLWLGRRALEMAVDQLSKINADLNIALIHHPLDWLHDDERDQITALLDSHVDMILRGHLHVPQIRSAMSVDGKVINLATGAAYQASQYPKIVLYVNVQSQQIEVLPIGFKDRVRPDWVIDNETFPHEADYKGHFDLPSTLRRKWLVSSGLQRTARIGPLEWLG
ncbi:metallophosphoesterase family protein, partial [Magnetococcales bacterium HHB-1]